MLSQGTLVGPQVSSSTTSKIAGEHEAEVAVVHDRDEQRRTGDVERERRERPLAALVEDPELGEQGAEGDEDADRGEAGEDSRHLLLAPQVEESAGGVLGDDALGLDGITGAQGDHESAVLGVAIGAELVAGEQVGPGDLPLP